MLCVHADSELACAYYDAVSPSLDGEDVLGVYVDALVRAAGAGAGWRFARGQGEGRRRWCFERVLRAVLSEDGEQRARAAVELVGLPFNEEEGRWFEEFLTGKGKGLPGARDTVIVRRVVMKRLDDTVEGLSGRESRVDGVGWRQILGSESSI